MDNKKRAKTYVTIVFLVVLGVAVTIGSFALWNQTQKQTNFNAIVSACLNLTIQNESPEITMDYAYPVTEREGLNTTGYSFTVTNSCDNAVNYSIGIESVNNNSGKQFIGNNYIDISLDGKSGSPYSSLDVVTSDPNANYTIRETRALATRQVAGHSSRTHTIRMWLDEDTPLSEQNKTFISKVTLTGGQGMDAGCYTVNGNGVLTDYDPNCGKVATIPESVNGHNITEISTLAFKNEIKEYAENFTSNIFEGDKCRDANGTYIPCTKDFAIVFSDKIADVFTGKVEITTAEEGAAFGASITPDDVYFIKYSNQTTGKYAYYNDSMEEVFDNYLGDPSITIDFDDVTIYSDGDALPFDGGMLMFYSINFEKANELDTKEIGSSLPTGNTVMGLTINSLDLSQATHLTKIDERAFSNMPDPRDGTLNDFPGRADIKTGLTSLTFGSNTGNIVLEPACFAKSELSNLTIYNTYSTPAPDMHGHTLSANNVTIEDLISVLNPFAFSTIGNLTVNQAGGNSTFKVFDNLNNFTMDSIFDGAMVAGISDTIVNNLTIGNNITSIELVPYSGITTLSLPNTLTSIGNYAFANNEAFTSRSIPSSVTSIGAGAFGYWVGNGINVTIPSSVTTIGDDAFRNKTGTITVGSQSLVDSKANWAPNATVTLSN